MLYQDQSYHFINHTHLNFSRTDFQLNASCEYDTYMKGTFETFRTVECNLCSDTLTSFEDIACEGDNEVFALFKNVYPSIVCYKPIITY